MYLKLNDFHFLIYQTGKNIQGNFYANVNFIKVYVTVRH